MTRARHWETQAEDGRVKATAAGVRLTTCAVAARHLIVDTNVLQSPGPHLLVRQEGTRADSMAAEDESR